jgi:molybdenum cofactor synthesis domain-containing protein
MQTAIVTVGDELLAGDTENTNATWLCRQLSDRGVTVRRILTVPDEDTEIVRVLREYATAYDAVIVTGGLGGTPDDVTIDSVAQAFDRPLAVNELVKTDVERALAAIAEDHPELDIDVDAEASIPAGVRPLVNDVGLSPGCVVEPREAEQEQHGRIYVFPGIPREMQSMFEGVADEFNGDLQSRFLYTDEPEAALIERLKAVHARYGVLVGCYPNRKGNHNRLKLRGEDEEELNKAVTWLGEQVRTVEPPSESA